MTEGDPPTGAHPLLRALGLVLRVLTGAWLGWLIVNALASAELPAALMIAAGAVAVLTGWRPAYGLTATAVLTPVAALLARPPARGAELIAWTFLAVWLLRLWEPLAKHGWPRTVMVPALLYGGAMAASWLSLTLGSAAGVAPRALAAFLFQSVPKDYLILSVSEPETWTFLQSATGLGVFFAAIALARSAQTTRLLAIAIATTLTLLAIVTPLDILRMWSEVQFGQWFMQRYLFLGERFSTHIGDVNAAGSLYIIGIAIAAAYSSALVSPNVESRAPSPESPVPVSESPAPSPLSRVLWSIALAMFPVAVWLTGSRSSYIGIACALVLIAMVRRRWVPRRGVVIAGVALILIGGLATSIGPATGAQGSARGAIDLRSQFTRTSARMFASNPLFGVGVGHYFNRSAEFMTDELREIYGNENAHNYFAQQLAELGVVGGLAFLWLVASVVWAGWHSVRREAPDAASLGLVAGTGGYLVTCITGHPLLVAEAALPFWAAFGAVAASSNDNRGLAVPWRKAVALAASIVLLVGVARATMAGLNPTEVPPDAGFHGLERYTDGTEFRWMTRHSVTHIPDGAGFIRLRVRGPDRNLERPLILETSIAGQVVDRRSVEVGVWATFEIPVRPTGLPFRRVDFRTNQVWPDEVLLGQRSAIRPVTIMTAELSWVPTQ